MAESKKSNGDGALGKIIVAVVVALLVGSSAPWWWPGSGESPVTDPPVSETTSNTGPSHCAKPTTPVLVAPGDNEVVPNHWYGQGDPWRLSWLPSSCVGGSIVGYRIFILTEGAARPAVDEVVTEPEYVGDTGGTISARNWTWKVRAIDDLNQFSDWSEERPFVTPEWRER
jgi:hypothetical protein